MNSIKTSLGKIHSLTEDLQEQKPPPVKAQPSASFCPFCGNPRDPPGAKFCRNCGGQLGR
ncbi:MAG: hypothetical protein E3J86_03735 [Candidatus Thorarchaeota archaeon]|nr:MAG: hypothetical protein E3J86_03735 [Candidatus Thorarchaeota archaeon]